MPALLLDSNALVLLMVGLLDRAQLGRHRRVRAFDTVDFSHVQNIARRFERHVSVPTVLSEASNLLQSDSGGIVPNAGRTLATYIDALEEIYEPSKSLVVRPQFLKLGLADAAIADAAVRHDLTVVTTDHALHGALTALRVNAVNLFHLRTPPR